MLIKSIEINNFRCFHRTEAKDLAKINLFGGKNNAGKTSLLEALLLMGEPSVKSIRLLLTFRRIDMEFIKNMPDRAWDTFFYKQNKNEQLQFTAITSEMTKQIVSINCDESVDEFINLVESDKDNQGNELIDFASSLVNKETVKSTLHIKSTFQNEKPTESLFIASGNGSVGRGFPYSFIKTNFIPASTKIPTESLAEEFDKAKLVGLSERLLSAFKMIDDTIESVDTFKIGKAAIYLKRKGEDFLPLTLFGDALNKVADYILRIVNNKNSIILIDEIENGIHHSNQEALWKMLFDLSDEFGIQIFATSHSAEMITAFKNVIKLNEEEDNGRYFEMARHAVTDEITIQKIPIDALAEKLITQKPLRGE